jgi:hypothetical protein
MQWYKNVLQNPSIRIDARGVGTEYRSAPLTDAKVVKSVVEKFRKFRQHVRIAPHLLDRLLAVGFEDSHRSAGAHAVGCAGTA